jgi:hypothetical protein
MSNDESMMFTAVIILGFIIIIVYLITREEK